MSEYTFKECFERLSEIIKEIDEGYWEEGLKKAREDYAVYREYGFQNGRKNFWIKCAAVLEACFTDVMDILQRDRLGNDNGIFEGLNELNEAFIAIVKNPEFEDDADGYMEALDTLESAVLACRYHY